MSDELYATVRQAIDENTCSTCKGHAHSGYYICKPPGQIDTYKGPRPLCNHCHTPLKPIYFTATKSVKVLRHSKKQPARHHDADWNEEKQRWEWTDHVQRVSSRAFQGRFGHHDLFCSKECGFKWACARAGRIFPKGSK